MCWVWAKSRGDSPLCPHLRKLQQILLMWKKVSTGWLADLCQHRKLQNHLKLATRFLQTTSHFSLLPINPNERPESRGCGERRVLLRNIFQQSCDDAVSHMVVLLRLLLFDANAALWLWRWPDLTWPDCCSPGGGAVVALVAVVTLVAVVVATRSRWSSSVKPRDDAVNVF